MLNLDTLDTVIAMVVVLLVLSLVVQSIQTFIKKLFKLKSKKIQESLEDLFQHVLNVETQGAASVAGNQSAPVVTSPPGVALPKASHEDVQALLAQVNRQFQALGRVTWRGRLMMDSLAKNDLLKVLTRVGADKFMPGAVTRFRALWEKLSALQTELDKVNTGPGGLLAGEASAKFAAMRDALAPLANDLESVLSGGQVSTDIIFGDLTRLRQIKLEDVLGLLGEVQQRVEQDRADAQKAGETNKAEALGDVADQLKNIATRVADLGQAFDGAFAQLRTRLNEVETWYDTVMQSFEERYTRHMRTVTFWIGAFVVVLLNANFFTLYQNLSTDPALRGRALAQGETILARVEQQAAAAASPTPAPSPAPSPAPTPAAGQTAPATPTPTPSADELKTVANDLRTQLKQLKEDTDTFGLRPLTAAQITDFGQSLIAWTPLRDDKGRRVYKLNDGSGQDCEPGSSDACEEQWRRMTKTEYQASRRHDISVALGWGIMTLLLSVGAPFWQDTLESLFGIKNLLRKRSDTKNVEDKGGQPRS